MYGHIAHALGYRTKSASRLYALELLAQRIPEFKNPVLYEVQKATEQGITGAVLADTAATIIGSKKQRQAAILGGTTMVGQHLGGRFLPGKFFPERAKARAFLLKNLPEHERTLRRVFFNTGRDLSLSQKLVTRGLGGLAGLATGLLALQASKHFSKPKETEKE